MGVKRAGKEDVKDAPSARCMARVTHQPSEKGRSYWSLSCEGWGATSYRYVSQEAAIKAAAEAGFAGYMVDGGEKVKFNRSREST